MTIYICKVNVINATNRIIKVFKKCIQTLTVILSAFYLNFVHFRLFLEKHHIPFSCAKPGGQMLFFLIPSQVVVDIAEQIITHILCTLLLRESASHVN